MGKTITKYRAFTRNWWRHNAAWPGGLEPNAGARKTYRGTFLLERDAREFCRAWNEAHEPGRLSNKAEYEAVK